MQEATPRDRRGSAPDGPTLFDLANPLELRVEPIAAVLEPPDAAAARQRGANEERSVEAKVDDITAELVRLLEEGSQSQPERGAGVDTSPQREKQDNLTESISFYWAAREWVA